MKTISIFQVQDINNLLKQKNYDPSLEVITMFFRTSF